MKPKERKLAIVWLCLVPIAIFMIIWHSQPVNVYRVQRHILRVMPLWQEFQRKNRGFEQVRFYSYTGRGGMFSAVGVVSSDADRTKLRAFMENTDPPRPVYLGGLRVLELDETNRAEQGAAANGNQP